MSKHKLYKDIRDQLSADYERELSNVLALIESGVYRIEGPSAAVECTNSMSLVSEGEAGKIFTEETRDTITLILQRYAENLTNEMDYLGLKTSKVAKAPNSALAHAPANGASRLT